MYAKLNLDYVITYGNGGDSISAMHPLPLQPLRPSSWCSAQRGRFSLRVLLSSAVRDFLRSGVELFSILKHK